jgi:geranylgeranyl diphosphate synthase, type I
MDINQTLTPAFVAAVPAPRTSTAPVHGQSDESQQPDYTPDGRDLLSTTRDLVEPALRAAVATLPEAMAVVARYHLGWTDPSGRPLTGDRGKALRSALTICAARAIGADPLAAVPAAVAVELVHNFSLLHDDVMDGDTTRRHRPTAWAVFGTNAALLAGNALLALALDVVATDPVATRHLTGAVQELIDGQSSDLSFERRAHVTLAECRQMALGKTGALLGCACALGAHAGGASARSVGHLETFGRTLGLAFQYVDDLLGIWGDPEVTGKPAHSDLASRKKSLPVVAALNSGTPAATALAELYHRQQPMTTAELRIAADLVEQAGGRADATEQADVAFAEALAELSAAVDGRGADLAALARLVVRRDH